MKLKSILIGLSLLGLAACGGGGGGGTGIVSSVSLSTGTTISNSSTGTQDFTSVRPSENDYQAANNYSGTGTLGDQLKDAHNAGWTGKGLTVTGNNSSDARAARRIVAPGADRKHWNNNSNISARVCRTNTSDCHTYNQFDATGNSIIASGNALVSHKFDTLTTSESAEILERTRRNGIYSLDRALSPVGNIN